MKHAGPETLRQLEPLLQRLRALPALTERTPGAFYLRSTGFLHFHEDPVRSWGSSKPRKRLPR
jgi:hypothetical protein